MRLTINLCRDSDMGPADFITLGLGLAALAAGYYYFWIKNKADAPYINFEMSQLDGLDYIIENNGKGVARFKEIMVFLDDVEYHQNPSSDPFGKALKNIEGLALDYEFFLPEVGDTLASGANKKILNISFHAESDHQEQIKKITKALRIELTYNPVENNNKKATLVCK